MAVVSFVVRNVIFIALVTGWPDQAVTRAIVAGATADDILFCPPMNLNAYVRTRHMAEILLVLVLLYC